MSLENEKKFTWYHLVVISVILFTVITRFYGLESKPFHHDESLYAYFSWKLYDGQGYKYDPMMHGPFLFYSNAFFYSLFGDSDYTARLTPAFTGLFMVILALWLKPFIGRKGSLVCAILLAISPTFMYFSRFLRMDILAGFFTFSFVVSSLYYYKLRENKYLYLALAALSLLYCTKENSYVHTIIFASYIFLVLTYYNLCRKSLALISVILILALISGILFLYYLGSTGEPEYLYYSLSVIITLVVFSIVLKFIQKDKSKNNTPEINTDITQENLDNNTRTNIFSPVVNRVLIATLIFWGIFFLFYTSFFQNLPGFLDGVYRKSIKYWIQQNETQRIKGSFDYYVDFLIIYELPVVLVLMAGLFRRLTIKKRHFSFLFFFTFLVLLVAIWFEFNGGENGSTLPKSWYFLHMETLEHLLLAVYVLVVGFFGVYYFSTKGDHVGSFLVYWMMFAFLAYSYLGEKVPWLLVHILLPQIILASKFIGEYLDSEKFYLNKKRTLILMGVALVFFLRTSFILCFQNEADPRERMIYVQTSEEIPKIIGIIHDLAARMKVPIDSSDSNVSPLEGRRKQVAHFYDRDFPMSITGNAIWPFQWYLRHFNNWFRNPHDSNNGIVIVDYEKKEDLESELEQNYTGIRVKIRWWWVPVSTGNNSFVPWLKYFFTRKVYSVLGSQDCMVYVRKDLLSGQNYEIEMQPVKRLGVITPRIDLTPELIFGSHGNLPGQLNNPRGIAVDSKGNIFVVNTKNNRIDKFDIKGDLIKSWGAKGKNEGQFSDPTGIALDSKDYVYVTDTWNHRIQVFSNSGKFLKVIKPTGNDTFWAPKGIVVHDNTIYITDTGRHRVRKIVLDGTIVQSWGRIDAKPGETEYGYKMEEFYEPVGIAINNKSKLLIADTMNKRISVYETSGNVVESWKVFGWKDYYTEPFIAIDNENFAYVTDASENRITLLSPEGKILAYLGGYGDKMGKFNMPKGIAYAKGNIFVVDMMNSRVQVFRVKTIKNQLKEMLNVEVNHD